ncbi:MAG: [FeFe] hydrogenase H-cluster radical SAM maturase HydE [Patescibacteria group bacterium]
MCLTIPAQITKLEKGKAIVRENDRFKQIQISLVPNLKVGDWILYINDLALKRIPKKEAKEILELLEVPYQKIDISKLSEKFKNIIQTSKSRDLIKEEIVYLLQTKGLEQEALFSEANLVRKIYIKDFICIHGIIEFSNFCKNDCFYCGLRKENQTLPRYRMDVEEIVNTAYKAVKEMGYKLLVLQSGEDYFYTNDILEEIIKKIKEKSRVFIFISIGERGYQCYKRLKKAGASGVLFRFETANSVLFKNLHPRGKDLKRRFEHLRFMKELGYFIATGSIVGLPGQTIEDLAEDILTTKKWAHMVSTGPFVPCDNTPLNNFPHGDVEMNLKIIAILRLLIKSSRIPVVTALETLSGEGGRKKALQAGANSLMFNLTPDKYRPFYKIYPDKFFQKETIWQKYGLFKYEESYKMLEERMQEELKNK